MKKTGHELIIFEADDGCMWIYYTILYSLFYVYLHFSIVKLFLNGWITNKSFYVVGLLSAQS